MPGRESALNHVQPLSGSGELTMPTQGGNGDSPESPGGRREHSSSPSSGTIILKLGRGSLVSDAIMLSVTWVFRACSFASGPNPTQTCLRAVLVPITSKSYELQVRLDPGAQGPCFPMCQLLSRPGSPARWQRWSISIVTPEERACCVPTAPPAALGIHCIGLVTPCVHP